MSKIMKKTEAPKLTKTQTQCYLEQLAEELANAAVAEAIAKLDQEILKTLKKECCNCDRKEK